MAASVVVIVGASEIKSLPIFTIGFIALFFFSGLGNGSTYKMIPAIFRAKAAARDGSTEDALLWARRMSGAVIGIAGAVGALGGLFINLAFRQSFLTAKSGMPAFVAFLAFYLICIAVTYVAYIRQPATEATAEPVYANI
jgi:NNP family nitrate/nitrite transporter-like MFS transporter